MSMQIFEESGVFDPSFWGLKVGDILQVIAVGGGGGGAASTNVTSYSITMQFPGGDAGKTSIYGDIECRRSVYSGGGGGGYGGGGGGGSIGGSSENPGAGGGGGYLKTATIKLTSLDPIAVTVGKGGRGGYDNDHLDGEDGEASSFGSYVVAEGGGGGKADRMIENRHYTSIGGIGGTHGGNPCTPYGGGGGGGGGYVIGCNSRGDGGYGCYKPSGYAIRGSSQNGSITGGGGGGDSQLYAEASWSCGVLIDGFSKGGSIAGGGSGQDGGPGDGVVVVTW